VCADAPFSRLVMSREPSTQMLLQVGGLAAAPAPSCAKPLLGFFLLANVRWGPERAYGNVHGLPLRDERI
jgi:hypothetical protein